MTGDSPLLSQVQIAHRHVRSAIISGVLPAGAAINQVEISRQLAISRTPVREALRMLQSEGLLDAQHQQRMRVSEIRPAEIDAVYSERILLECLAIAITAERASPAMKAAIQKSFDEMKDCSREDLDAWEAKHKIFHQQLAACASEALKVTLANYADRAERFRRVFIASVPRALEISEEEHSQIREAVIGGLPTLAVNLLAKHLARTALTLLSTLDPQFEPTFIRRALTLVVSEEDALRARPMRMDRPAAKKADGAILRGVQKGPRQLENAK